METWILILLMLVLILIILLISFSLTSELKNYLVHRLHFGIILIFELILLCIVETVQYIPPLLFDSG